VVAERSISYVDEDATQLRREAEERLVPAVFQFSDSASRDSIAFYRRFSSLARSLFTKNSSAEAFKLAMQAEFPGLFSIGYFGMPCFEVPSPAQIPLIMGNRF